jgi:outer membrane protein assembly factor BamB
LILSFGLYFFLKITDRSGKLRWEVPLKETPVLLKFHQGILYALFEPHTLKAFKAKDGKALWEFKSKEPSSLFPYFKAQKNLGILCDEKTIYVIDLSSGKIVHRAPQKNRIFQTPVDSESTLFFLTEVQTHAVPAQRSDGELIPERQQNRFRLTKWSTASFSSEWSIRLKLFEPENLMISESHILVVDHPKNKKIRLLAFESQTGKQLWKRRFPTDFYSDPKIVIDKESLLLSSGNKLYLLTISGKKVWEKSFDPFSRHFGFTQEGNLIVASNGTLSCYRKDGDKLWQKRIGPSEWGFAVSRGRIYIVGSFQTPRKYRPKDQLIQMLKPIGFPKIEFPKEYSVHRLYSLSSNNGKRIWKIDGISGEPLFYANGLFLLKIRPMMNLIDAGKFLGESSRLICINPRRGKMSWRYICDGMVSPLEISKKGIFFARQEVFYGPGDLFTGRTQESAKISLVALYE